MKKHNLATGAVFTLAVAVGAAQAGTVTYTDDFEAGANPTGWNWNGFNTSIQPAGGNPGGYLADDTFFSWPQVRSSPGAATPFHGDYQALQVSNISLDTRTFSNQFGGPAGVSGALLLRSNATGMFAWTLGPDFTDPNAGWITTNFPIPSQEASLPAGWVGDSFGDPFNWTTLMQNVDQVELWFLRPDYAGVGPQISVGFDNASITFVPEPAGLLLLGAGGLVLVRRRF